MNTYTFLFLVDDRIKDLAASVLQGLTAQFAMEESEYEGYTLFDIQTDKVTYQLWCQCVTNLLFNNLI